MKKNIWFSLLSLATSVALANGGSYVPVQQPEPVTSTHTGGFYIGAGLSAENGKFITDNYITVPLACCNYPSQLRHFDWATNGFDASLLAGYQLLLNSHWALGFEGFGDLDSLQGHYIQSPTNESTGFAPNTGTARIQMNNTYGASILPGLWLSSNSLLYARLGWVESEFKLDDTSTTDTGIFTGTNPINLEKSKPGVEAGIGLETFVSPNVSIRTEYDYTHYSRFGYSEPAIPYSDNAPQDMYVNFEPSVSTFTVAGIYHFYQTPFDATPNYFLSTGIYAGLNIRDDELNATMNGYIYRGTPYDDEFSSENDFDFSASGIGEGLLLGYADNFNNHFRIAIEADGGLSQARANYVQSYMPYVEPNPFTITTTLRMQSNLGISLLPGVMFSPGGWIFARVGAEDAHFTLEDSGDLTPQQPGLDGGFLSGFPINDSFNKQGIILGLGAEDMITSKVSMRLEYDWTRFGSYHLQNYYSIPDTELPGFYNSGTVAVRPALAETSLSIIYHFNA